MNGAHRSYKGRWRERGKVVMMWLDGVDDR